MSEFLFLLAVSSIGSAIGGTVSFYIVRLIQRWFNKKNDASVQDTSFD